EIKIHFAPLCSCERPLAFRALFEMINVPHLQQNGGLSFPSVLLAFKKIVEEALLQFPAVIGVKVCPMFQTVHLKPLLPGCRAHKSLEIAARMQSLAAPVCCREERHSHLGPICRAALMEVIVQRMSKNQFSEIGSVAGQYFIRQRFGAANQVASGTA